MSFNHEVTENKPSMMQEFTFKLADYTNDRQVAGVLVNEL